MNCARSGISLGWDGIGLSVSGLRSSFANEKVEQQPNGLKGTRSSDLCRTSLRPGLKIKQMKHRLSLLLTPCLLRFIVHSLL